MSKQIVTLKIDVTKISKERLYKGKKGTYLDAVVFLDPQADQYGNNGMITESVSKEEREAGTKGAILGNAKIISGGQQTKQTQQSAPQPPADEDDLPF